MALHHNPRIVTDSLVRHLDAANVKSYSGTGSTWYDMTKNQVNATKAGSSSPTYPQYNSNGYFTFIDGEVGNNYNRFDLASPAMDEVSVLAAWRSRLAYGHVLRLSVDDYQIGADGYAAGNAFNDIQIVPSPVLVNAADDWRIGQLSFDGETLIAFTNGTDEGSATMDPVDADGIIAGTLRIGARNDAHTNHFEGDIAIVMVWNRALTAAEMEQNFNALRGRFGI
jgi:hypothetical protein